MNRFMMAGDRGVGLVIVMMVMLVIVGLTGPVMSLATTQTAVAANYRRSLELLYAAGAALELVVQDLGRAGSWEHAWRFFGRAQPQVVAPGGSWSEPQVVAVWLANDVRAIDVDPGEDGPPQLIAYAVAFGSGLSHRAVQATIRRHVAGWVEVTSWRVAR